MQKTQQKENRAKAQQLKK